MPPISTRRSLSHELFSTRSETRHRARVDCPAGGFSRVSRIPATKNRRRTGSRQTRCRQSQLEGRYPMSSFPRVLKRVIALALIALLVVSLGYLEYQRRKTGDELDRAKRDAANLNSKVVIP